MASSDVSRFHAMGHLPIWVPGKVTYRSYIVGKIEERHGGGEVPVLAAAAVGPTQGEKMHGVGS